MLWLVGNQRGKDRAAPACGPAPRVRGRLRRGPNGPDRPGGDGRVTGGAALRDLFV